MINICAFTLICSTLVLNIDMHLPIILQVFSLGFVFNVCQLLLIMFCCANISKGWVWIGNLRLLMIIGQLWIVTLMMHQPHWGEPNLHPLFLILKLKVFSKKDQVWFMKIFVGKNMLCLLSKRLTKDWKKYCNHMDGRCFGSNWIWN